MTLSQSNLLILQAEFPEIFKDFFEAVKLKRWILKRAKKRAVELCVKGTSNKNESFVKVSIRDSHNEKSVGVKSSQLDAASSGSEICSSSSSEPQGSVKLFKMKTYR